MKIVIFLLTNRMDMESASKMRRHENMSSSEEDDLVDLLGNTYQVIEIIRNHLVLIFKWTFYINFELIRSIFQSPTGIYYDVDCESSDQQHGSTLQSNLDNGGPLYSLSNAPRVPMSTYSPNPRMYQRNWNSILNSSNSFYTYEMKCASLSDSFDPIRNRHLLLLLLWVFFLSFLHRIKHRTKRTRAYLLIIYLFYCI